KGMDESSEIGPLVNQSAFDKVEEHVTDALNKGASLIVGGEAHKAGNLFYKPPLLSNVTSDRRITNEETFGPVCPVYEFETEAEASQFANDTVCGLAAYYYTRGLRRATRGGQKLQRGIIGVKDAVQTTVQAPFGGMKESGLGREGGHQGISGFLEEKYLSIDIE